MSEEKMRMRLGMTQGAAVAFGFLALGFCLLAAFNIYLWNDSRTAKAELRAEHAARLDQHAQDVRSANVAKVSGCRQAVPILNDLRTDYLARAATSDALAAVDPSAELMRIHRRAARTLRKKAGDLPDSTQRTCDELARALFGKDWRKIPGTLPAPKPAKLAKPPKKSEQ